MSNELGGVWRTIGGRRVFIKDGDDIKTAMEKSGKFKNTLGRDKSADYLKNREVVEVDSIGEMKNEVNKFIQQSIKKYKMEENDIKGEIHVKKGNASSFSNAYGKEINEYIDIHKDEVTYVTLSEKSKYYGMKEKKTIDLR